MESLVERINGIKEVINNTFGFSEVIDVLDNAFGFEGARERLAQLDSEAKSKRNGYIGRAVGALLGSGLSFTSWLAGGELYGQTHSSIYLAISIVGLLGTITCLPLIAKYHIAIEEFDREHNIL